MLKFTTIELKKTYFQSQILHVCLLLNVYFWMWGKKSSQGQTICPVSCFFSVAESFFFFFASQFSSFDSFSSTYIINSFSFKWKREVFLFVQWHLKHHLNGKPLAKHNIHSCECFSFSGLCGFLSSNVLLLQPVYMTQKSTNRLLTWNKRPSLAL